MGGSRKPKATASTVRKGEVYMCFPWLGFMKNEKNRSDSSSGLQCLKIFIFPYKPPGEVWEGNEGGVNRSAMHRDRHCPQKPVLPKLTCSGLTLNTFTPSEWRIKQEMPSLQKNQRTYRFLAFDYLFFSASIDFSCSLFWIGPHRVGSNTTWILMSFLPVNSFSSLDHVWLLQTRPVWPEQ